MSEEVVELQSFQSYRVFRVREFQSYRVGERDFSRSPFLW
jgi:hypothetical protein